MTDECLHRNAELLDTALGEDALIAIIWCHDCGIEITSTMGWRENIVRNDDPYKSLNSASSTD